MTTPGERSWVSAWLLALAIAAAGILKIILLVLYGPLEMPDSAGYIAFSGLILQGPQWLYAIDLSKGPVPVDAVRTFGYPLLLALFRRAFAHGEIWKYSVVILQMAVSLAVTAQFAWVLRVARLRPALLRHS